MVEDINTNLYITTICIIIILCILYLLYKKYVSNNVSPFINIVNGQLVKNTSIPYYSYIFRLNSENSANSIALFNGTANIIVKANTSLTSTNIVNIDEMGINISNTNLDIMGIYNPNTSSIGIKGVTNFYTLLSQASIPLMTLRDVDANTPSVTYLGKDITLESHNLLTLTLVDIIQLYKRLIIFINNNIPKTIIIFLKKNNIADISYVAFNLSKCILEINFIN